MKATFLFSKNLPNVNNQSMGEKSPNLVALPVAVASNPPPLVFSMYILSN
jgi:hypothetical protein